MNSRLHKHEWQLAHGKSLTLGPRSIIMGILNVTPDSFSDGGKFVALDKAIGQAQAMIEEGASIIDIGGESTRPGAEAVSETQEQDRVVPIIEALSSREDVLISIDTYRASTAEIAIKAGAHIINDVWGFQKDEKIADVAKNLKAGCCAMHTGRERKKASDLISDQLEFLQKSVDILKSAGVLDNSIVLDPGFGFAKDPDENAKLLSRLEALHELGYPLLIGTSRKRFIGHFTGRDEENRDIGTAATSVVARMKGSHIFRVHDVRTNADALAIADAILHEGKGF